MKTAVLALVILAAAGAAHLCAQGEPILVPDVVDYTKLLPILPEAPAEWTADKPEGDTSDATGSKVTTVHRDYRKGDGDNVPITSISIIDCVANPEYVQATTTGWQLSSETPEGYSKPVTIDGNAGSESYEKEQRHATLRLVIAARYFLAIDLQGQDPKELQEWIKRINLKKLAEIK